MLAHDVLLTRPGRGPPRCSHRSRERFATSPGGHRRDGLRLGGMRAWSSVDVPRVPGSPPPLRLHDTAGGEIRPDHAGGHRPDVRLRHHALRRDAPRPRGDLPGVRPDPPPVARRGPRRALRPERHRHRRPAARAGRAGHGRLGRARDARDGAVPRGHGRAADPPAARLHRGRRGHGRDQRAGGQAPGQRRGLPRRRPRVPGRLPRPHRHPGLRLRLALRRGTDARGVPRARRRPRPSGQAGPARRAAVAHGPRGRAVVDLRPR